MSKQDRHSTLEVDLRPLDTQKQPRSARRLRRLNSTEPTSKDASESLPRRRFWIIAGAILAVSVIVGVVVGGVVGSRKSNSGDGQEDNSSSSTSAPSPTAQPDKSSHLAAVVYRDHDSILQHRLYYQASDNVVHEYARNDTNDAWYHLSDLGEAIPNSPISATVTQGNTFDLRMYFLKPANFIDELMTLESGGGPLYTIYQDTNGNLNFNSSSGWWKPSNFQFGAPAARTPLSLIQSWLVDDSYTNLALFYLDDSGGIAALWWNEEDSWTKIPTALPASSSDPDTSLVAFLFSPNDVAEATKAMGLLVSNSTGVTSFVNTVNETFWDVQHPAAMSSLDPNSPLAATQDGRVFGVAKGVVKEFRFASDGSWSDVGEVLALP